MSMFNDISCDRKDNKDECLANAGVVKVLARRFGFGQWSFIGPGSEKKWYSSENSPQGAWDNIAEKMLLEFAQSGHPIFRATTPLSRVRSKVQDVENCRYTSLQILANAGVVKVLARRFGFGQWSFIGPGSEKKWYSSENSPQGAWDNIAEKMLLAVANMCEDFETHQDRSGQLDVLMGQSIVLSEIKAEVSVENDIPSHQNLLLQRYEERIKLLSQEDKVSKFF